MKKSELRQMIKECINEIMATTSHRKLGAPTSLSSFKKVTDKTVPKERKPYTLSNLAIKNRLIDSYNNILDKLKELDTKRNEIESEQENDQDVLDNPYDGSNPSVIMYGKELERIDNTIRQLESKFKIIKDKLNTL